MEEEGEKESHEEILWLVVAEDTSELFKHFP